MIIMIENAPAIGAVHRWVWKSRLPEVTEF